MHTYTGKNLVRLVEELEALRLLDPANLTSENGGNSDRNPNDQNIGAKKNNDHRSHAGERRTLYTYIHTYIHRMNTTNTKHAQIQTYEHNDHSNAGERRTPYTHTYMHTCMHA